MECGGVLHRGDFRRKPRGVPEGIEAELGAGEPRPDRRLSFCCGREGCRKRHTPPSLRFFGRRVYVGVVVVVMMAVATEAVAATAEVSRLARELGVSRRTLERWRGWWRVDFPETDVWRDARGRVMPPVDAERLPASLLERLLGGAPERVLAVLRLCLPLPRPVAPDTS